DEAAECYDRAIGSGADDTDLMLRVLRHYRRSGQFDRALAIIERLMPSVSEPASLARLWAERGTILARTDAGRPIEAFATAPSYDPGSADAVSGLAQVLEQRGDWKQLSELLEAHADMGEPSMRAEALRQLASIAEVRLFDMSRAERYLRAAI